MKTILKYIFIGVAGYFVFKFLGYILLIAGIAVGAGYLGVSYVLHKKFMERP